MTHLLEGFSGNLKLARLRRKYSSETVAQRAVITRRTHSKVEQGDAGVALGIYARVMQVLRLENDLAQLAVDDVLGRKLQDAGLTSNAGLIVKALGAKRPRTRYHGAMGASPILFLRWLLPDRMFDRLIIRLSN
jgi:transcriptional regulator with XRE-family HTH domain